MKFCLPSNKIFYDWEHLLGSYQKHVTKNSIVLEIGASNEISSGLDGIAWSGEISPDWL